MTDIHFIYIRTIVILFEIALETVPSLHTAFGRGDMIVFHGLSPFE